MDDEIRRYLQEQHAADHVIEGGIEGLIESWERAVKWLLETEAPDEVEFMNDADGRQHIEEIRSMVPIGYELEQRLVKADQKFRALTAFNSALWAERKEWYELSDDPEDRWWYTWRPRSSTDDEESY